VRRAYNRSQFLAERRALMAAWGNFLANRPVFAETWNWEVSVFDSLDHTELTISGQPNSSALQAALNSPNQATALNPFIAGLAARHVAKR